MVEQKSCISQFRSILCSTKGPKIKKKEEENLQRSLCAKFFVPPAAPALPPPALCSCYNIVKVLRSALNIALIARHMGGSVQGAWLL